MDDIPRMVEIVKIEEEAKDIRTFYLDCTMDSEPGQFIMMWLPDVDEKPFSIGFEDSLLRVTIAKVGAFTEKLFTCKAGDKVGVRGPYGKPFAVDGIKDMSIALVGGGYGAAPLSFLAHHLEKDNTIYFFTGARTKDLLIYREKLAATPYKVHYATDDGSHGYKGYVTDTLLEKIDEIEYIFTVGPELMMKAVVDIAVEHGLPCQLSLERYMKCGYGVCGVCCVDPTGWRMCMEGPCITKEEAMQIEEFGKYHRDAAGKKVLF